MKRGKIFALGFILFFSVILSFNLLSASLGISPAKITTNFKPNTEESFTFVITTESDIELEIYATGDLSEYVFFDKKELIGGGTFTATLKFPNNVSKPGAHRILVGAREKVDKELIGTIGTLVAVQSPIDVIIPYPGRYLEIELSSHNVNIGDPVKFTLKLMNKGNEDLTLSPVIEVYSDKIKKDTITFETRDLKSQEEIGLQKELDTTNYSPGRYNAIAVVNYGSIANSESEFRVGSLFIELINYTKKMSIGGINKFEIEIESNWNNKINGAHAEVSFLENGKEKLKFKTSPIDLEPWEKKTIDGFFDTSNFTEGKHNANLTLTYYGESFGSSSNKIIEVEFIKKEKKIPWMSIGIAAVIGINIILFIFFIKQFLSKNGKKKK